MIERGVKTVAKGDVIGMMPCVACEHRCRVREDVNGSPYWVCGECGCRVQVGRDPEAQQKVRAKMGPRSTAPPAPAPPKPSADPAPKKEAPRGRTFFG